MTGTVLILGASGKIGQHAATAFSNAGWTVRKFNRKTDNMSKSAMGADVIVNGLNPPNYHNWAEIIPAITKQVIAAAKVSGATVIIPGNVYNFGDQPGEWSENTPQNPVSRKGQIRKDMEQAYRDAGVRTVILRAGNFIDPDRDDDVMKMIFLRGIRKGKIGQPGDPDALQAFAYLPDWARAAVELAEIPDKLDTFEDVPFPGHAFSINELKSTLETHLGRKLKLAAFPWWAMTMTAPFWELARELLEMRYLWNTSHSLSGNKFSRLLPDFRPTDLHTVVTSDLGDDVHPNQSVARRGDTVVL